MLDVLNIHVYVHDLRYCTNEVRTCRQKGELENGGSSWHRHTPVNLTLNLKAEARRVADWTPDHWPGKVQVRTSLKRPELVSTGKMPVTRRRVIGN